LPLFASKRSSHSPNPGALIAPTNLLTTIQIHPIIGDRSHSSSGDNKDPNSTLSYHPLFDFDIEDQQHIGTLRSQLSEVGSAKIPLSFLIVVDNF